jgi:hypothetical protein
MVSVMIPLAVLSILFGILILIWPKVLNYLIAVYLILVGLLQIIGAY